MLRLTSAAVALFVGGCATSYQQSGVTGGFTETQLSENVWRVSFRGNGLTRGERAEDFALLRSADLTLLNGFTHFALADARTGRDVATYTAPVTATTTGSASILGNSIHSNATTHFSGGGTTFISRPTASNTVVMFKGKPELSGMVFDARFICTTIAKKYEVTCDFDRRSETR